MKTQHLFIGIVFMFSSLCLNAQEVSTGITKIKLKTAPEFIIEKVTFNDENFNDFIDAGENCFFELTIKNIGKTPASHPIVEASLKDSELKNLTFDNSTSLEQINAGDVKIIQIDIVADEVIKTETANFTFIVSDNGKYKSKPTQYDQKMQEKDVFLATEWYYPTNTNMISEESVVKVRLCVKSKNPLQKLLLYQNEVLIRTIKEFSQTDNNVCSFMLEEEITLNKGSNELKVIVKNDGKTVTSDKRIIIFKPDYTEFRNALVIGNSHYAVSPLKNPENDAKEMSKALIALNFDVVELIDADKRTMRNAIRTFNEKITKDKGVGLFYYAGHGMQVKGENYLIPVNHDIQEEFDIEDEAIRINSVLSYMQDAGSRMNIVILDACRDNPYARSTRSGTRGLATITSEGSGSIIAYATAPGSTASDGDANNGLYTQELLKAMKTPGLEIGMVFRKVLQNVKKQSKGGQIPWTTSSIEGEFFFSK